MIEECKFCEQPLGREARLLKYLKMHGETSVINLSKILGMTRPNINYLVNSLEKKAKVQRIKKSNGRVWVRKISNNSF